MSTYETCLQVTVEQESELTTTYKNLLHKLPDNTMLDRAYEGIADVMAKARDYVNVCNLYEILGQLRQSLPLTLTFELRFIPTSNFKSVYQIVSSLIAFITN